MRKHVELVPFRENFLADAAELLAARHRRDRAELPELPARFEKPAIALKAIEAVWHRPRTSGVAALDGGRVAGYLFADLTIDAFRGRIAWMRWAGHALDPAVDAELYRDLYAAAGPGWLARGFFKHYALVPAAEEAALAAWYGLGFGQEQVYALRPLTEKDRDPGVAPKDVTIRRAKSADGHALSEMATLIARHQAGAPVWVPMPPEDVAELREGYAEVIDDAAATVWLAMRDNQILGFQAYFTTQPADDNPGLSHILGSWRIPMRQRRHGDAALPKIWDAADDDPLTPEACIELKVAGTRERERGKGIGRALTRRGFAEARAQGYTYCLTDWVATNLLSSRFWPRQGFRPMVYRLMRTIDSRVVWADGRQER
jgi:GNAT superfamily N-acetyltransferase